MIKMLEDLLIEASTNPNVPGSLVAGLRKAVDAARASEPPPCDSMEEAQRAAGSYRVCIRDNMMGKVGEVMFLGNVLDNTYPSHADWLPCDKDGWVASSHIGPMGLKIEWRDGASPGTSDWRPAQLPQVSAIDEMAEQMKRWAEPTRSRDPNHELPTSEDFDNAIDGMSEAMGVPKRWLVGQAHDEPTREDSKPTNPKDAAATDRVPLGLLSPIAKAHWALAQHCGRAKYGAWNWREAGVRASIYIDAIGRHADGYLSGETYDPADGTHHLGNIMACCAILLEAEAAGKLTDDRPPTLDMRPTYAEVQCRLADITAKYADRNPKHWTR